MKGYLKVILAIPVALMLLAYLAVVTLINEGLPAIKRKLTQ